MSRRRRNPTSGTEDVFITLGIVALLVPLGIAALGALAVANVSSGGGGLPGTGGSGVPIVPPLSSGGLGSLSQRQRRRLKGYRGATDLSTVEDLAVQRYAIRGMGAVHYGDPSGFIYNPDGSPVWNPVLNPYL